MEDPYFLECFWALGDSSFGVRLEAVKRLREVLKGLDTGEECSPIVAGSDRCQTSLNITIDGDYQYRLPFRKIKRDKRFLDCLEYTINRLIHGLSSDREYVRIGYAVALGEILNTFPDIIPLMSILDAVRLSTSISSFSKEGCSRNRGLGCLVGYGLLLECNFFSCDKAEVYIQPIVEDLCRLYNTKVYFRDVASTILAFLVTENERFSRNVLDALQFKCQRWMEIVLEIKAENFESVDTSKALQVFGFLSLYLRIYRHFVSRNDFPPMDWLRTNPTLILDSILKILTSSSVIFNLHPIIPSAWRQLVLFFTEDLNCGLKFFKRMLSYIMKTIFTHPKKKSELFSTKRNMRTQKVYAGLRLIVEILGTLKKAYFEGSLHVSEFIKVFWSFHHVFLSSIIAYQQAPQKSASLCNAANCTMILLTQIVKGFSPSSDLSTKTKPVSQLNALNVRSGGVYVLDRKDTPDFLEHLIRDPLPSSCGASFKMLLEGLRKANALKPLHISTLNNLVYLTFDPQDVKIRSNFVKSWLSRFPNSVTEWIWKFDFAVEVSCACDFLVSHEKAEIICGLLFNVLFPYCFRVRPALDQSDVVFFRVKFPENKICYVFPYFADLPEVQRLSQASACRRVISRLSSAFGNMWSELRIALNSCNRSDSVPSTESPIMESSVSAASGTRALRKLVETFCVLPFSILKAVLKRQKKKELLSYKVRLLSQQQQQQSKKKEHSIVSNDLSYRRSHATFKLKFRENSVLSHKQVRTCVKFGAFLAEELIYTIQLLENAGADTRKLLHDLVLILTCLICLPIRCLILACVMWSSTEKNNLLPSEANATLQLMRDAQVQLGGFFDAVKISNRVDSKALFEVLQMLVDIIPEFVLDNTFTTHSPLNSITQVVSSTSQGLISCSFLFAWRHLCQYASSTCLETLIDGLLTISTLNEEKGDDELREEDNDSQISSETDQDMFKECSMASQLSKENETALDTEMGENVIEKNDVMQFLLNETDENGLEDAKLLKNEFETKTRRHKQHLNRLEIQQKLRRLDLLDQAFEVMAKVIQRDVTPFNALIQHYRQILQLYDVLKKHVNYILRFKKKNKQASRNKKLQLKIYQDLCRRLELTLLQCCKRLLHTLQYSQHIYLDLSEDYVISQWKDLRKAFQSCRNLILKPLADQGCLKSQESIKVEEYGALTLLTGGLLEQFLWRHYTLHWGHLKCLTLIQTLSLDFPAPLSQNKDDKSNIQQQCSALKIVVLKSNETSCSIEVSSSGLLICDYLTSVLYVWVQNSHPPIGERFFRSLSFFSKRFLCQNPLFGLLGVPFVACAKQAKKLFVLREALTVSFEILECFMLKQDQGANKFFNSFSYDLLIQHLYEWMSSCPMFALQQSNLQHGIKRFSSLQGLPFLWMHNFLCILNLVEDISPKLTSSDVPTDNQWKASFSSFSQKNSFRKELNHIINRACLILERLPFDVPEQEVHCIKERLQVLSPDISKVYRLAKKRKKSST